MKDEPNARSEIRSIKAQKMGSTVRRLKSGGETKIGVGIKPLLAILSPK